MNNEAVIETTGDSQLNGNDEMVVAQVAEQIAEQDVPVECVNGVCVLNWKPTRPAAA